MSRGRRRTPGGRRRSGPWWQRTARALGFLWRAAFAQESFLFFPSRAERGTPADVGLRHETVWLEGGRGQRVRCWWLPGEGTRVVLFLPGAVGNITQDLATLRYLHRLGGSVLAVDYPGYGGSSGAPSEAGCYRAAEAAWRLLREERGVAPEDIIVYGRSLGAAVAMWLAARERPGGVVFHGGFSSVEDLAARHLPRVLVRLFCRLELDAVAHAARCPSPLLQLHGRKDQLIPPALAARVHQAAAGPHLYLELEDDHMGDGWCYDERVRQAWRELLAGHTGAWRLTGSARGGAPRAGG